ncbi:aminotransferase class I/II-fold pyridoxal phosphate-dependent enzyme [Candidatus Babeliales bacterium]|nr:aminotransferase class I/II-fold pyridoxal phosphate-dependent enzyme [Candidatus Babeliales bacterium]
MKIAPFNIEKYFEKYEGKVPYILCSTGTEPLTLKELLELADKEILQLWENLNLAYMESSGHYLLRNEITKLHTKINPENILTSAPVEGIFLTFNSLLEKGDHVIVTFPAYEALYKVPEAIGCEVTKWEAQLTNNGWTFDISFLKDNIKNNTKLIVINFPHNPTGYQPSKEEFNEIIELARKNNIILFSDEIYRFLEYNPKDHLNSASDIYENAISLFGLSKTFGMPGLRSGWLTTQNLTLIKTLKGLKDYTTIAGSIPGEILSIITLKSKDQLIKRNLDIIQNNLKILDNFFDQHKEKFVWHKPKAATIGFIELLLPISSEQFCSDLIEKAGILLMPSQVFEYKRNTFRLGFGKKNMPLVIKKLESYLKGL